MIHVSRYFRDKERIKVRQNLEEAAINSRLEWEPLNSSDCMCARVRACHVRARENPGSLRRFIINWNFRSQRVENDQEHLKQLSTHKRHQNESQNVMFS